MSEASKKARKQREKLEAVLNECASFALAQGYTLEKYTMTAQMIFSRKVVEKMERRWP